MSTPDKLKPGDEIRVIAPARSMSILSDELKQLATNRLTDLGYKVTFGANVNEMDDFRSSSIKSRIDDLHEAFSDRNVKGILSVIGGFNSNQLLDYIDWKTIAENPKVFCGFSDITALTNAFFAKTGMISYSGPHYSSFGQKLNFDYTLDHFIKCCVDTEPFSIVPSEKWSDDPWYADQQNRDMIDNDGFLVINHGAAEGTVIGGNLCTLNLLQGTEYMPDLTDSVLFIEDDEESSPSHFDRDLVSLTQQLSFAGVKGLVIGRFQKASNMTDDLLTKIIKSKRELDDIPVIANVDFGHTDPKITIPIGGTVSLDTLNDASFIIHSH